MHFREVRARTGTSGFSYAEWKGSFYPPDIEPSEMLRYYGSRFDTVEINNTFYRQPSPPLLGKWAAQVPAGFVFSVKAPQVITHQQRLDPESEALTYFVRTLAVLGPRLGAVLFQLPPSANADVGRLREFLGRLPAGLRAAFEFRHPSWLTEETAVALADAGAALCLAESDERTTPVWPTARFGYLRLRRTEYSPDDLASWARTILEQPWEQAFVYLKHEDRATGPRWAAELGARLRTALAAEPLPTQP